MAKYKDNLKNEACEKMKEFEEKLSKKYKVINNKLVTENLDLNYIMIKPNDTMSTLRIENEQNRHTLEQFEAKQVLIN